MPSRHAFFRFSTASLLLPTLAFAATSPEKLLGHPVGADRKLADYGQIVVTGRAAIVEANLGKGRVELLGARVQQRAQMVGTYKFLFNAILRGD